MNATAITYRTGESRSALRTVLVEDARRAVVLLPTGRLEIMTASHLHGTTCRHQFWDEALGLDPSDNTFAVPVEQVTQIREVGPVKTRKHCR